MKYEKIFRGQITYGYLPADTLRNAEKFISIANPELVIFVKYEFWNNYISALYDRDKSLYTLSLPYSDLSSISFNGMAHFSERYAEKV